MKFGGTSLLGLLIFYIAVGNGALMADTERVTPAVACSEGPKQKVQLRSTDRLPGASGEAKVERRGDTTNIEVNLDQMKPAWLFGGDYNTYVLWVVSPGGRAENLGELLLDGARSRLQASMSLSTFALLVTAEPHYLVSAPSAFVVLEGKPEMQRGGIHYPVVYSVIQGTYNFERSTLSDVKEARGRVHTEVKQAFTALRLAQRAGAANLAPEEFALAERALDETLKLWRQAMNQTEIAVQARETIALAVAAQHLATDRAFAVTRVATEGSGGGNSEAGRRYPRGTR